MTRGEVLKFLNGRILDGDYELISHWTHDREFTNKWFRKVKNSFTVEKSPFESWYKIYLNRSRFEYTLVYAK